MQARIKLAQVVPASALVNLHLTFPFDFGSIMQSSPPNSTDSEIYNRRGEIIPPRRGRQPLWTECGVINILPTTIHLTLVNS